MLLLTEHIPCSDSPWTKATLYVYLSRKEKVLLMGTPPSPRHPFQERARSTLLSKKAPMITRVSIGVAVIALVTFVIVGVLYLKNMNTASRTTTSSSTFHTATTASATPSPRPEVPQVGSTASNFTLSTLAGDQNVSLSDYQGKPVLLNFWSLNCSDCLKETPIIQRYYATQRARGKELVVLGINMDFTGSFPEVAHLQEQQGLTYPILVDDHYQARTHYQVRTLYHVTSTPTSFFIDRQGIIRAIVVGSLDTTTLQKDAALLGTTTEKQILRPSG